MISHKHKFIFVEFSKTGTTAIDGVLEKYCETKTRSSPNSLYFKHARPKQIKELFEKENKKDEWKHYFKFTFTRNPFDRLVSNWHYIHKSLEDYKKILEKHGSDFIPNHIEWIQHCQMLTSECKTFKEYIKLSCAWPTGNDSGLNFAFDKDEKFVDFIGKFENLQEDFNIICDKIGIPQQQLPHKNKTKHKHYTEYYDDETRELVAKKFAKDIEYFGYEFGE